MFDLALLPDQLELWIFQNSVKMGEAYLYEVFTFGDNVRTMFDLALLSDQLEL